MGNLLIFGGTFDPPHKGHLHLLKTAIEQVQCDKVLLIPAYQPPHKERRPSLSFENRVEVLNSWFGSIPNLEISDIEQKRGGKSFTYETVDALQIIYPQDTLHLLIGTDMFLSFEEWRCFEHLLETVILVVGSRELGDRSALEKQRERLMSRYKCKGIILCSMKPVVFASSSLRSFGDGLAERILKYLNENLDSKRVSHTLMVADYARNLAQIHEIDVEKAYLAALLHDCTKSRTERWQIDYAKERGIELTDDDLACPQILHQITAPIFAAETFGIDDQEILSAIGCHTTGKVDMTLLDRLIFFADGCEPSRNYPGVEELRKIAEQDLNLATLRLLERTIDFINDKNAYLHPKTLAAKNDISKELNQNG